MDWLAVGALAVALFGVLVAIVGVVFGGCAMKAAKAANKTGDEALIVGKQALSKADRANDLSVEANTLAHRTEARETELHDVHWQGNWIDVGVYQMVNMGEDTAYNVRCTIIADGDEVGTLPREVVHGAQVIDFEMSRAGYFYAQDLAALESAREASQKFAIPVPFRIANPNHSIRERVHWVTAQGKPMSHDATFDVTWNGPDPD